MTLDYWFIRIKRAFSKVVSVKHFPCIPGGVIVFGAATDAFPGPRVCGYHLRAVGFCWRVVPDRTQGRVELFIGSVFNKSGTALLRRSFPLCQKTPFFSGFVSRRRFSRMNQKQRKIPIVSVASLWSIYCGLRRRELLRNDFASMPAIRIATS